MDKSHHKFSRNQNQLRDPSHIYYFKLPYIGNLSDYIDNTLLKLCKEFCKKIFYRKLVFDSFKIKNYLSYKNPISDDLKSSLVYKFTYASCSSSYIGETCRHFKTRNISKRIASFILLNIYNPPQHALTCLILFLLK